MTTEELDKLCINTIRFLAVDAVEQANSGHPGLPLGAAPMAYVLWSRFLRHDPRDPGWWDRDRFVLSAGPRVGAAVRAAAPVRLRPAARRAAPLSPVGQPHARPPGVAPDAGRGGEHRAARSGPRQRGRHGDRRGAPRRALQPAGPRHLQPPHVRARQRRRPDGGRRRRGRVARRPPAARAADRSLRQQPRHAVGDDVDHVHRGRRGPLRARTAGTSIGWPTATISSAIDRALRGAIDERERPSLIVVDTVIGYGAPNKSGTFEAHGSPLGPEETARTKRNLGWPAAAARSSFRPKRRRTCTRRSGARAPTADAWRKRFDDIRARVPGPGGRDRAPLRGAPARSLGERPAGVRARRQGNGDAQGLRGRAAGAGAHACPS